jgi:hypothetical protein
MLARVEATSLHALAMESGLVAEGCNSCWSGNWATVPINSNSVYGVIDVQLDQCSALG